MRFKLTLILLLANLAVFFALWQLGRQTEAPMQPPGLIPPELTAPDHIEIANKQTNETNVLDEKANGQWRITSPVNWPANEPMVEGIISKLQFPDERDSFSLADASAGGSTLESYGLDDTKPKQPHLILTLSKGTRKVTLYIGNTINANTTVYVRNPADNRIHTVPVELLQSLDVATKDLRDENIFTIGNFSIQSIKIRVTNPPAAGGNPAADASGQPVTLNRDGDKWSIESAGATSPADPAAVNSVISRLSALTAERFLTKDEQDPGRQFTSPSMTIEMDGLNGQQQKLVLGGAVPNAADQYYARFEDSKQGDNQTIFIVKAQAFNSLLHAQESLREHHFLAFDPAKISGITVDAAPAEIRLQKLEGGTNPDPWQVAAQNASGAPANVTADTALVTALLDNLRKLEAQVFTNDDPSAADLKGWGLAPGDEVRKVTLTRNGDKPITLDLGIVLDAGGLIRFYARVEGEKPVYELGFTMGNDIQSQLSVNPLYYRNRLFESLPAGAQISALKLTQLNDAGADVNPAIFDYSPDFSKVDSTKDAPWHAYLQSVDQPPNVRDATYSLEEDVRNFKVDSYLQESFTDHFQLDAESKSPRPVPWRYRLDAVVVRPAAGPAPAQTETLTFYFSERLGASTQFGGTRPLAADQPPAMIFKLSFATIGELNSLTLAQTPPPAVQGAIEDSARPLDPRAGATPSAPAGNAPAVPPPVSAASPAPSGNITVPSPAPPPLPTP